MNAFASKSEWIARPLIEVATLQRGYDLPVQDRADGPHPIFAANGTVGFHVEAKCRGPGVVTGRSGTIGKVHFVDCDYWPLNTSLYVNDFHGNDPKWVFYMLQSFGLERFSQGAGVPTLNRNLIHGEPIRVPSVLEQRRIAAILDQADALSAKRREALAQLDSLTQSIFIEMFGDPTTNAKEFPVLSLGEICDVRDGTHDSPKYVSTGFPLVTTKNLRDGVIDFADVNLISEADYRAINKRSKVDKGDILMPMIGTIGSPILVRIDPAFAIKNMALIKFKNDSPDRQFVLSFLSSDFFEKLVSSESKGGTQKFLSLGAIRGLQIPVPPPPLQQTFATRIQSVEALKVTHRAALQELDRLFASLQHRAFQGEL